MAPPPDYKHHAALVDRMATTLGLDLEDTVMQGALRIDTLGDAVLKCAGCRDVAGCERWLAAQEGPAEHAPDICRNGDLFDLLKDGGRA